MLPETFFYWFIIIINAGKLNCKNYSITTLTTDLVFQEHSSQIQDFFSTSVQFHNFSGPEKSKLKFQDSSGLVGTLVLWLALFLVAVNWWIHSVSVNLNTVKLLIQANLKYKQGFQKSRGSRWIVLIETGM